jgi:hypothetical protein
MRVPHNKLPYEGKNAQKNTLFQTQLRVFIKCAFIPNTPCVFAQFHGELGNILQRIVRYYNCCKNLLYSSNRRIKPVYLHSRITLTVQHYTPYLVIYNLIGQIVAQAGKPYDRYIGTSQRPWLDFSPISMAKWPYC